MPGSWSHQRQGLGWVRSWTQLRPGGAESASGPSLDPKLTPQTGAESPETLNLGNRTPPGVQFPEEGVNVAQQKYSLFFVSSKRPQAISGRVGKGTTPTDASVV